MFSFKNLQRVIWKSVEIRDFAPSETPEAKAPEFSPLDTGAEVCFALASASDDTWSA